MVARLTLCHDQIWDSRRNTASLHSHVMAVPRLRRQEQQQQQRRRWRKRDGESRHLHSTSVVLRLVFLRIRGRLSVSGAGSRGATVTALALAAEEWTQLWGLDGRDSKRASRLSRPRQLRKAKEMFMLVVDQPERANCGRWLKAGWAVPPPAPPAPPPPLMPLITADENRSTGESPPKVNYICHVKHDSLYRRFASIDWL